MFARSAVTTVLRRSIHQPCRQILRTQSVPRQFSSTSTSAQGATAGPSHPWAAVTSQLDHVAPRFEVDAAQIEIIDSPAAFYSTLKVTYSTKDPGCQAESVTRIKSEAQGEGSTFLLYILARQNTSWSRHCRRLSRTIPHSRSPS